MQIELKKLKMQFPNISNYISKFEKLCQNARYTQGAAKTANFFLSGLSGKILADVLKPPFAQGYNDIKHAHSLTSYLIPLWGSLEKHLLITILKYNEMHSIAMWTLNAINLDNLSTQEETKDNNRIDPKEEEDNNSTPPTPYNGWTPNLQLLKKLF